MDIVAKDDLFIAVAPVAILPKDALIACNICINRRHYGATCFAPQPIGLTGLLLSADTLSVWGETII